MTKSVQNHIKPMELEAEYDYISGIITEDANISCFSLVLLSLPVSGSCTSWMSVCSYNFIAAFPFASVPKPYRAKVRFTLVQQEVCSLIPCSLL